MLKIEFEGTDGAGKTTGLKYFINKAKSLGLNVVETREVGNPHITTCVKLREFVLDPANKLSGEAMECIFAAMRFENYFWENDLYTNNTDLVVSDRGLLSHLAYTDHNVSKQFTKDLYKNCIEEYTGYPNIVIYFRVDSKTALSRRVSRGTTDVIELKGIEFQEKVRESFKTYLNEYAQYINIYTVDANQTLDGVKNQLDYVLEKIIDKYGLTLEDKLSKLVEKV